MSSVRRLKDRGGAGGKISALNPSKPFTPDAFNRSLSGKENSRGKTRVPATATATQKPAVKVVPRVDKAAVAAEGSEVQRKRWSTSSGPRGRSPSPTQFSREPRVSRVSSAKKDKEISVNGLKTARVLKDNVKNGVNLEKIERKSAVVCVDKKAGIGIKVDKNSDEDGKGKSEERSGKNPSKLHEKLAFLEGKVKRIASDIKRTKEMLDANNHDVSKVILSDIQNKISGIEKAMGNVVGGSDGKAGLLKGNEGKANAEGQSEVDVKCSVNEGDTKCPAKELNSEELEARLLPHYKLLRDRGPINVVVGNSQSQEPQIVECRGKMKVEDEPLNSLEENTIQVEFLASLNKEQSKVTIKGGATGLKPCVGMEMDSVATSSAQGSLMVSNENSEFGINLTSDEKLEDFDDQENRPGLVIGEETEDDVSYPLKEIGGKTSTAGWFVSEGEAVLLAHDDGSCSYYDIVHCEEKTEFKPPEGVSPNMWRDCWILRAPSSDGCSGKFVVAASAGNSLESGFCSWDFYTGDVQGIHIDGSGTATSRTVLGPLPNNNKNRRFSSCTTIAPETRQWWYRPCGPLIISAASSQKVVKIHDIRDGEQIMSWETQNPVSMLDFSSPLQWRNRGSVVVAETETISLWDVNSLAPQASCSIPLYGRKISAIHVNNTDGEIGGGVRRRATSSEAEVNNGVFCTPDWINILDFRDRGGVGLRISNLGVSVQSVFSRGDDIFLGCTNARSVGKRQSCTQVQQFSLRKQGLVSTYDFPDSNVHTHHAAITQVWGNSEFVMAVCGLGLFVFDPLRDDGFHSLDFGVTQKVKQVVGPDDLYSPSFDYSSSRALLISRDRPAVWKHLKAACIL